MDLFNSAPLETRNLLPKDGTVNYYGKIWTAQESDHYLNTLLNTALVLEHGSLLVMKDSTQTHCLHRLPPTKLISKPRVNLTFRTIVL